MNILLIEDNPVILKLMEYTCGYEKHTFKSAMTGSEGMKYLEQNQFDLVISDENLPEIKGHQIAKWMRQNTRYEEVPLILISVEQNHQLFAELSTNGSINMFIPKPFTIPQLTSALNMVRLVQFPLKVEVETIEIDTKDIELVDEEDLVLEV